MIVWSVVLPIVGTLIVLLMLGFGIARSRGLRDVLIGLRGKGKVSLLNLFSVEGAGLVLILALFVGGGIVYPLANAASLANLERLARNVEQLRAEAKDQRENAGGWQIVGAIEVPGVPQGDLRNRAVRVTIYPWVIDHHPPSGNTARFTAQIPVKHGADRDSTPSMLTIYVEYDNYKTLAIDVPRDAFNKRVIHIDGKLEKLPAIDPDKTTRPDVPESWEARR